MEQPETIQENRWQDIALIGVLILLAGLAVWMIISQFSDTLFAPSVQYPADMDQTAFIEETGVRIVLVAMTAGIGMIDIRYQIVDPDKAVVVHDVENPPGLIDEKTDALLNRTRHEGAHDFELHPGVIYSVQIMNSAGILNSGSTVSVQIGDARLEHITVQ